MKHSDHITTEQASPVIGQGAKESDALIVCIAAECSAACDDCLCPYSHFPLWQVIGSANLYSSREAARTALALAQASSNSGSE